MTVAALALVAVPGALSLLVGYLAGWGRGRRVGRAEARTIDDARGLATAHTADAAADPDLALPPPTDRAGLTFPARDVYLQLMLGRGSAHVWMPRWADC